MSRIGKQLPWALGLVLLTVEPAAANMWPGPGAAMVMFFGPLLLITLLILLSTAGGAYPILARLDPNRNRWWRIALRWVGALGLIIGFPASCLLAFEEGLVGLVGICGVIGVLIVLGYLWLRRSIEMLQWAKQARSSDPAPVHLATASPRRLRVVSIAVLVVPILSIAALVSIAARMNAEELNKLKPRMAASDAKTAVTQGLVYTADTGAYPPSIRVLREKGYANLRDTDPWGNPWMLAPVLTEGRKPQPGDDVYVYSKGPCGTGTYQPGQTNTGKCGAIGYSSIHGYFRGQDR